ncbi:MULTISPECIES: hypothetical protein [Streptomyces]|uniref:Uncharacterized protein n=2 Tax=Streptomyces TaxID=1883 RepID=A0ABS9JJT7_9ACTN|nr:MULTISPECIES: hypothetical protein [Streptomyces]MCG0065840.1 hypothetical protein [Streptomyces tricolor]BCM72728.1 hypothetical protein EASAB2608_08062 [Streptomyces sp. EAS-AB2608]CUW33015.1 hypothetical protein TUE45_pSRTUE45c_0383 [Streptomyces reticuli]
MNDDPVRELPRPAPVVPLLPQQTPAVDRTSAPAQRYDDPAGVEADFLPMLGVLGRLLI